MILIERHGALHGVVECFGTVGVVENAGDAVVDRVGEPTDPAGDWQRAVQLGPHLRQPARLIQRGHHQEVRPGQQVMLERVSERRVHRHSRGEASRELMQRLLELGLAGAEENELRVQQPQRLRRDDLIEALLRDQPRAHAE